MAIKKYVNNAWTDIGAPKKNVNNAWQECDSAKKYANSAWQEVWSGTTMMNNVLEDTTQNTSCSVSNDGSILYLYKFRNSVYNWGSLYGSGYITVYAEGTFVNPWISFGWVGGLTYYTSESYKICQRKGAGRIRVYARDINGKETYTTAVDHVGPASGSTTTVSTNGEWYQDEGFADVVLPEGTYDRIGLRIELWSYSNTLTIIDGYQEINIQDVFIENMVSFKGLPEYDNIPNV